MPRRNRNAYPRERRPLYIPEPTAPESITFEAMARSLVARGLASSQILDRPPRTQTHTQEVTTA